MILTDRPLRQCGIIDNGFHNPDLGLALPDHSGCFFRIADRQFDLDVWIFLPEGDKDRGQPVRGNGLTGDSLQRPPPQTADILQNILGGRCLHHYRPCLWQKQTSCIRQSNPPPNPMEKLDPIPHFQRRNGSRNSGLGHVHCLACGCDVLAFCDSDEKTKLI